MSSHKALSSLEIASSFEYFLCGFDGASALAEVFACTKIESRRCRYIQITAKPARSLFLLLHVTFVVRVRCPFVFFQFDLREERLSDIVET